MDDGNEGPAGSLRGVKVKELEDQLKEFDEMLSGKSYDGLISDRRDYSRSKLIEITLKLHKMCKTAVTALVDFKMDALISEKNTNEESDEQLPVMANSSISHVDMRNMLRHELNAIVPEIKGAVSEAVKIEMKNNAEETERIVKTYSQAVENKQKKLVDDVTVIARKNPCDTTIAKIVGETAGKTISESLTKLDADILEREKRANNVMVSNVRESQSEDGDERKEIDLEFCIEKLGMTNDEIETVYRAGPRTSNTNSKPRPLIIKLKDIEDAQYWHRNGKGYNVDGYWINKDLCQADRNANFQAREARRKRLKDRPTAE